MTDFKQEMLVKTAIYSEYLRDSGSSTYAVMISSVLPTFQSPSIVTSFMLVPVSSESHYLKILFDCY